MSHSLRTGPFWIFSAFLGIAGFLAPSRSARASGGYDIGTAVGEGRAELDLTWNPFDMIPYGQSYIVWKLGLTERFMIHGYYSHEARGTDQNYFGLFYQFLGTPYLDLATAVGGRLRRGLWHSYLPQLLYNARFAPNSDYSIGGSIVVVSDISGANPNYMGTTYDIALFVPILPFTRLGVGAFRSLSEKWAPTYSVDIRFPKFF